jgi:multiple sugar transport system substrate-binding protein
MKTTGSTRGSAIGSLDRRAFLKAGGAAAALALAPGLIAGKAEAAFSGTLEMLAWDFQPDTIKKLVSGWTEKGNPAVNVSVIPNLGYSPALQTRLRGGDKIDLYYNFAYNSQKFIDQGWAAKLNGLAGVDDMLADMFESARARHVNAAGDVISVPYFSAVHMLHYNQRMLADAGLAAPKTLKEIYDASKALQSSGKVAAPYVATGSRSSARNTSTPTSSTRASPPSTSRERRSSPTIRSRKASSPGGRRCTRRASPRSRC